MHIVHSDSITYVDDGSNDLVFPCFQPEAPFREVPGHTYFDTLERPDVSEFLKTLPEPKREEYLESLFQSGIRPRVESGESLCLNGTFVKGIYDYMRKKYAAQGYFSQRENRYALPKSANVTLGIDIASLVYDPGRKPSAYVSQWAVRANIAALNDGIITRVFAYPDDAELARYLGQSHAQLQRIAHALGMGWQDSNGIRLREFTLRVPPPFWSEVPSE